MTFDEADIRKVMELFKVPREKAIQVLAAGFRVGALGDEKVRADLMEEAGFGPAIDKMKHETEDILNHAEEDA